MKVRGYAVALLLVAGVLPLAAYGYLSIDQSKRTTISEARRTNQLLSQSAAERISEYLRYENRQLVTAGTGMLLASGGEAQHLGEAYLIAFPHWHNLTVLAKSGKSKVLVPSAGYSRPTVDPAPALAGAEVASAVREADPNRDGPFAHSLSLALPLEVAGAIRGAVLADIDLISIWEPINAIRVGKRGFARLVTADGTVLAHGDPAERQDVFAGQKMPELLQRGKRGQNIENRLGETAITALAAVDGTDWSVIIEQPESEALAAARSMQRSLMWLIALTGLFTVFIGLWAGRGLVRSLETMEAHTKTLAGGDLSAKVDAKSVVHEVESLAESINTMASSLDTLHKDATARERITTFGRVAAGLAHDLRLPIETIQNASQIILENPRDTEAIELFRWTADNEIPKLRGYLDDLKHLATEGSVGLHRSRVEIVSLMEEVTARLSVLPKWDGIAFEVRGSAQDAIVDAELLRRAVSNLAANAADATVKQGQGRVTLEVGDAEASDDLRIRVIDNGHGMAEEALRQVLSGDFRSTKRANGVGLGFGAARHIVQSHGGEITGSSEVGVGTTMEVCLPRGPVEDEDRDRALQE